MSIFRLIAFAAFCVLTTTAANAQDTKTVVWNELWKDIHFNKISDGTFDFSHGTRPLFEYTLVEIPGGTLSVRHSYRLESGDGIDLYLVVLDPALSVNVHQDAGVVTSRPASVRLMFTCKKVNDEAGCRQTLDALLKRGVTAQSLGSGNSGYEQTGVLPEGLIFSFRLNMEGRITTNR